MQIKFKFKEFERKGVQEGLRELAEKIRGTVAKKRVKIQIRRPGRKKWWNKECRESKTELNRKLKEHKEG